MRDRPGRLIHDALAPRPLVVAALGLLAGRAGGAAAEPSLLLAASLPLLAAAAGLRRRSLVATLLALAAVGLLLGALPAAREESRRPAPLDNLLPALSERPLRVTGRPRGLVRSTTGAGGPGVSVELELERIDGGRFAQPLEGRPRLLAGPEARELLAEAGRVEAWVRLHRPAELRNLGVRGRPGPPPVLARVTAVELLERRPGRRPLLDRLRERVARALRGAAGERRLGAGLARALVLGERDELDRDLQERLRAGGTAHVLAVSGLHCALVTWAAAGLAALAGARRRGQALVALLTAWAFAALAGFGVPVLRAASLVSAFSAGRLLGRALDRWNALAAALLLSGLLRPEDVLGAGWCLTFGATAGLLALTGPLRRLAPSGGRPAGAALRDALAASLAAWLALLPLQLALFGRCNPLAPLLNLAAVPLAGLATGLSLAAAAAAPVSEAAAAPFLLAVDRLAALLGLLDASAFALPAAGVGAAAAGGWVAALAGAARGGDPRRRFLALLVGLAAGRELLFGWPRPLPPGVEAAVTVLDVGQGSATLVELRSGRRLTERWLVDGGGRPGSVHDVGARTVVPALRALGVRRLDGLVMSHADQDHRGGLPAVLRELAPRTVLAGPVPPEDLAARAGLFERARAAGARAGLIARGSRAGSLGVLGPRREPGRRRGLSGNDLSVVLEVPAGRARRLALLPGDVEAAGERALEPPAAAVLVVPHHGSRTSTTPALLAAVRPRLAIVSAGAGNRFDHPHAEVLDRLAGAGAALWSTAEDGAVRVELRGGLLHVRSGRGGGGVLALDGPRGAWEDSPP